MDIIEHYIKNSSLVEIPTDFAELLNEASDKNGGLGGLATLFTIDSHRDNKKMFISKVDSNDLRDNKNKKLKIKDKKLWKQMKAELLKANNKDDLVDWGNKKGKINQLFGVVPAYIGKAFNDLSTVKGAKKPSGEDWEAMIAVALAFKKNKNADLSSGEYADEWKRINDKGFWGSAGLRDQANNLADAFLKEGIGALQQIGGGKGGAPVSSEWSKIFTDAGKKDKPSKTPKTDVKGDRGQRISLKKKGGSQIMSAKRIEAFATLEVAFQKFGENESSELKKVFNTLKTGVLDTSKSGYKGTIDAFKDKVKKLKDDGSPQALKELEDMQNQIKDVEDATQAGNVITLNLNQEFSSNPKLKEAFVFEAASGDVKFGTASDSRADTIVEFDPPSGKVTKYFDIEAGLSDLTSKCHFYASFKTGSGSTPYIALRGNIMKAADTAKKAAESAVNRLAEEKDGVKYIPTFSTIMKEAFNKVDGGNKVLNENFQNLNEMELFNSLRLLMCEGFFSDATDLLKRGVDNVKGGFKKLKDSTMEVLKKAWKWVSDAISAAFDFIVAQGKKAIRLLMKFFGVDVDRVDFSSSI